MKISTERILRQLWGLSTDHGQITRKTRGVNVNNEGKEYVISSERHALNCQIYRGLNRLNSLPAVKCWLTDICQSFNPSTQPHCFAKSKQNVANWRKKEQLILVDDKICFHSRVLITGGREKAYLHAQSGFFQL